MLLQNMNCSSLAEKRYRPGSVEPAGGAARFQTVAKYYSSHSKYTNQANLITLFSGDAFNPSLESSITKGRHMVLILNVLGPDAACLV